MSKTITKVIAGIGIVAGLGVAALPLSSYAANPQDVTVQFKVDPTLAGDETICETGTNPATGVTEAGGTATVQCAISYSANGGASVSIKDKDANTNLVGATATNTIASFSTTANQSALVPGTEGWGYTFASVTAGAGSGGLSAVASAANFNGVSATAVTVGSNTAPVSNASGLFTFGAQTAITTEADTYQDVVTIAITPAA